jgi:alginate O-acetyltransferase complex protein AlgI
MVFTSHIFIFYFLPAALLVYYNLPYRWRNWLITLASYLFYGWWKPWFVFLMMATTVLDYLWGRIIASPRSRPWMRLGAVLACCITNLGLLAFFNYYMFGAESLNLLRHLAGQQAFDILRITLPIGISFYTFHTMSYVIDLYRGDALPARSFSDFSCFVAMFPDLVAGPIIRYHTIADQLAFREHTVPRFASGVALFVLGLAKKILLANTMGTVADAAFGAASPGAMDAWFGVTAYALQIYFDFCGYSDMAVGLGRMLGFELPKNFSAPYLAESITDLWRRWHISLSTFLRDYLYIPIGGSRKGPVRTYWNLAVTMLLGGLWHGAKWNFLAWGAYHGTLLALERRLGKRSLYARMPRPLRIGATFTLMLFSWVLFRAADLTSALHYFGAMFGTNGAGGEGGTGVLLAAELYTPMNVSLMALCGLLIVQPVQAHDWSQSPQTWRRLAVLVPLFLVALIVMAAQAFNPFLYFQF